MALGHRIPKELPAVIATGDLAPAPAHPFYQRLNRLPQEADFDTFVEDLCRPSYAAGPGRPGIPPGIYFRMLFVGYFEGLGARRGIAWRCSDSRAPRASLGYLPAEATPGHSSLTKVRQRLPEVVHDRVCAWVLQVADAHGLLHGQAVGGDSTPLEANAAMKAIRRRDTGDDRKAYLRKLAAEDGLDDPSDEGWRRPDRQRQGKEVSNDEWVSPAGPDSRVAKRKDGTTHLAYKAEHIVDLQSDLVLAAEVYPADQPDSAPLLPSAVSAQANPVRAGSGAVVEEAVTDKGYHKVRTLAECAEAGVRAYTGEQRRPRKHVRTDKPAGWRKA